MKVLIARLLAAAPLLLLAQLPVQSQVFRNDLTGGYIGVGKFDAEGRGLSNADFDLEAGFRFGNGLSLQVQSRRTSFDGSQFRYRSESLGANYFRRLGSLRFGSLNSLTVAGVGSNAVDMEMSSSYSYSPNDPRARLHHEGEKLFFYASQSLVLKGRKQWDLVPYVGVGVAFNNSIDENARILDGRSPTRYLHIPLGVRGNNVSLEGSLQRVLGPNESLSDKWRPALRLRVHF